MICHHDPGPNNTVFRDGQPRAFIDFDFAAPGDPLEDVGYLAWAWCVSSRPDRGSVTEQARQVRTLVDAYGLGPADRDRLPGAIRERLRHNETFWREMSADEAAPVPRARSAELVAWTRRELAYVETNQEVFIAALAAPGPAS